MPAFSSILLDTPTLLVVHEPHLQLLRVIWRGQYDSALAQADCEKILTRISDTHCTLMLNDSSEVYGNWWESAAWIGQVYAPELGRRGIQAVAWINAMDWPSRHSVASTLPHIQGLEVQIFDFDEQETAYQWLQSKAVAIGGTTLGGGGIAPPGFYLSA